MTLSGVIYSGMNPLSGPPLRCQFASCHWSFATAHFSWVLPECFAQVADRGGGVSCDAAAGQGSAKADRGFVESVGEIREGMTRVKEFLDADAGFCGVDLASGCQLIGR